MENEKLLAKNLFDYSRTIAKPLLETVDYPWEALPKSANLSLNSENS